MVLSQGEMSRRKFPKMHCCCIYILALIRTLLCCHIVKSWAQQHARGVDIILSKVSELFQRSSATDSVTLRVSVVGRKILLCVNICWAFSLDLRFGRSVEERLNG